MAHGKSTLDLDQPGSTTKDEPNRTLFNNNKQSWQASEHSSCAVGFFSRLSFACWFVLVRAFALLLFTGRRTHRWQVSRHEQNMESGVIVAL